MIEITFSSRTINVLKINKKSIFCPDFVDYYYM